MAKLSRMLAGEETGAPGCIPLEVCDAIDVDGGDGAANARNLAAVGEHSRGGIATDNAYYQVLTNGPCAHRLGGQSDPVTFARLLGQNPWRAQQEILWSAARNPLTAVKSCHASGKTFNAAAVALWALARWRESLVITTAPTFRQVKVLWNEIAEARKRSRINFPEPSATELKLADKRYAVGLSTNDPNKFQSYHAAHVLIIADEAQGILGAIWEAVEGIRAGGDVRVLMQGNPTVTGGHYQDAFGRNRAIGRVS